MHIKFTRMEYRTPVGVLGPNRYMESKKSVWIPVEDLRRVIVCQEENCYRLVFGRRRKEDYGNSVVEVVKENPIELLKKYEEEKDKERIESIRKPDRSM